ncbi:hypothetical protein [Halosegnis marinus]
MGTITGAAFGGAFFYILRTVMRNIEFIGELYFLVFAVVTLLFLFFLPQGIVPAAVNRLFAGGSPGEPVTDGGSTDAMAVLRDWMDRLGGEKR